MLRYVPPYWLLAHDVLNGQLSNLVLCFHYPPENWRSQRLALRKLLVASR